MYTEMPKQSSTFMELTVFTTGFLVGIWSLGIAELRFWDTERRRALFYVSVTELYGLQASILFLGTYQR